MHKNERGMSFWPFVITLILLLVFVFMWFSTKSERDEALAAKAKAESTQRAGTDLTTGLSDYLDKLGKPLATAEREGVKSYSRKNWYCRGQVS